MGHGCSTHYFADVFAVDSVLANLILTVTIAVYFKWESTMQSSGRTLDSAASTRLSMI